MKNIQDLLNYLNVDWHAGHVDQHYGLQVMPSQRRNWVASIVDYYGDVRIDSDTGDYFEHYGKSMQEVIAALDAQCAATLERIKAY